jgi:hypothetical protein
VARTPGEAADRVATEVEERIERLATLAADAILHSLYAPQVVSPPRAQQLDYWRPFYFTPDGYVNQPGRDQVVTQVGGPEYKRIAYDLARQMRQDGRATVGAGATVESPPEAASVPGSPAPPSEPTTLPPLYGPRTLPAPPLAA